MTKRPFASVHRLGGLEVLLMDIVFWVAVFCRGGYMTLSHRWPLEKSRILYLTVLNLISSIQFFKGPVKHSQKILRALWPYADI